METWLPQGSSPSAESSLRGVCEVKLPTRASFSTGPAADVALWSGRGREWKERVERLLEVRGEREPASEGEECLLRIQSERMMGRQAEQTPMAGSTLVQMPASTNSPGVKVG